MHAEAAVWPVTAAPTLRGWPRLQACWVDRIKRAALRHLHASAEGERLVLRIYLIGEEATELALQRELLAERPAWLALQMDRHLAEEQGHARAFAAALAARGSHPTTGVRTQPDWLSRRKIAQWHRLAHRHAPNFRSGMLVPAFAIGLCAEQMASRVLQRHCDVLAPQHPLRPLLSGVLSDEERHVRQCGRALATLAAPSEHAALQQLLGEIRAIDRAWGVTGALALWLAGAFLRLAPTR